MPFQFGTPVNHGGSPRRAAARLQTRLRAIPLTFSLCSGRMPARVIPLAIVVLLAIAPLSRGHAIHEPTPVLPAPAMRLIVIEVPGCFYCRLFRRDVLPLYEASPRGREIPMLVLGLETAKARRLAFARPINVLPTVVLFRAGKEIGRIPGYMAPDIFLRSINYLLLRKG